MVRILPITPQYAVSPGLAAGDYRLLAQEGYRTVISFLPDSEQPAHALPAGDAAREAELNGIHFLHIPASKFDLMTDEVLLATSRALREAKGPVVGTCASGQRAAIVWAGAEARTTPVSEIMSALTAAGFNFSFLRDDFETQAQIGRLCRDFQNAA